MTKHRETVSVNNFVLRQIKGSGKTYSENLTFNEIAKYAEIQLNNNKKSIKPGYRSGVILICCEPKMNKHFVSPIVKINEQTKLEACITKRNDYEESYIQIRALTGRTLPTQRVELVLYHHDVLTETNEQTTNSDWELISIHAVPKGIKELPMGPVTMMRNQLKLSGGTNAYYSSKKWAESVSFWQKFAFLKPTK